MAEIINKNKVWINPREGKSRIVKLVEIKQNLHFCEDNGKKIIIASEQLLSPEECQVCNFCGNIDIQKEAWVHANSGKYEDEIEDCSYWCGECEVHPKPIMLDEYLKLQNNDRTNIEKTN